MHELGLGIQLPKRAGSKVSDATPSSPSPLYLQPDGASFYFQPDGSSFYLQP